MRHFFFRLFVLMIILLGFTGSASAQCVPVTGTFPDSTCAGSAVTFYNNTQPGLNYSWDFCSGALETTPVGINPGSDANLSFPQGSKLIKDGGNYYLFVANYSTNSLIRYDYGTSLDNTPTVYNYGQFGFLWTPIGLDVAVENGEYYVFVMNSAIQTLTRIYLGPSIAANTAIASDLGSFPVSAPYTFRIVTDGSSYFGFATNVSVGNLTRFEFGNSLTNQPTSTNLADNAFNGGTGLDIKYDCTLNKWVGFLGNYFGANCQLLDFGSSLLNVPNVSTAFSTAGSPGGLELAYDNGTWFAAVVSYSDFKFQTFKFNDNLLSGATAIFTDTVGQLNSPRFVTLVEEDSGYSGFVTNAFSNSIARIKWTTACSAVTVQSQSNDSATVVFNGSGFQNYTITATDNSGLTSYYTDSIFVNAVPVVDFTNSPACAGAPVQFTDGTTIASGNIANWNWNFGDNSANSSQQNPAHVYSGVGNYYVTLTATSQSGCSSSDSAQITVSQPPSASYSFTSPACQFSDVVFTDNSTVATGDVIQSWSWDYGDGSNLYQGQNAVYSYDSVAVFNTHLTITTDKGCSDSLTLPITIKPAPVAGFTASQTCSSEIASFTNTTSIAPAVSLTYSWDFGNSNTSSLANPTNNYQGVTGDFPVTLIVLAANGCSDTIVNNVHIASQPVPAFTFSPTVVCVGNSVSFTSQSSGSGTDTISQYIWDFGDLSGSLLENPVHAFADTGVYNVTLTVVSPTYCDSSITLQVSVIPAPTGTFTAPDVCLGLNTPFSPFVTTPPGTQVDSVVWTFGDGTFFTGITSPVHLYNSPGTYNVSMTVYNNLLCTGTFVDSVKVYPIPVSDFDYTLACSNAPIYFDGSVSTVVNDTLSSWLWNFSGQGTSLDTTPVFTFPVAGNYNVTLIVTTVHGCTDTLTNTIQVIGSPDFDFTFDEPCLGAPANFTYIENTNPPPPANMLWDFGDNNQSSVLNPAHLYASPDTFTVSLIVLNPNTGCSAQKDKLLVVRPLPQTGFTFNNGCENTSIAFTDTTSILSGTISSWDWDLGPAGSSQSQNPSGVFPDSGLYSVSMTATSDFGCTASQTQSITIYPSPRVAFVPDPLYGSPPLTVNFTNNTFGAIGYAWNFGDGGTATIAQPSHVYQDTGLYQIVLTGTSGFGCIGSATQSISVLVPYIDVAVENTYFTINNNLVHVSANIINKGNLTVNEMTVKSFIDDGTPVVEQWTGELKPGNAILYQLPAGFLISGKIPGYICVEALNPNGSPDENPSNNLNCEVSDTEFEVFSAFPNPFQEQLNISFNLPFEDVVSVEMHNMQGQIVARKTEIEGLTGFNTIEIDTRTFAKGVYSLTLTYRGATKVLKVVRH